MSVGPDTPVAPEPQGCYECEGGGNPLSLCPSCEQWKLDGYPADVSTARRASGREG